MSETAESDIDYATRVLKASVEHGRKVLAAQMPSVEKRQFDFVPEFKELTIHLFLVGVMWRFGEQFDLPTNARDRAFAALSYMLASDGMSMKAAQRKVADLYQIGADHENVLAINIGYRFGDKEAALAEVFERFRNDPKFLSAPYRLIGRAKPIAAVLAIVGVAISVLIGRSWGEALGIGIVVAVSTLVITTAMYFYMTRKKGASSG